MKLSFSFSKTAAPKKQVLVHSHEPVVTVREVVSVNEKVGVEVHKSTLDVEDQDEELVIPVKTLYVRPDRAKVDLSQVGHDALKQFENTSGIIAQESGMRTEQPSGAVHAKKRPGSILMQIQAAKKRGEVRDAPDVPRRQLDPDEFGWALMRGMGYDPEKDTSPDVTQTVVGNRTKLGLGVKAESIALPTDKRPQ